MSSFAKRAVYRAHGPDRAAAAPSHSARHNHAATGGEHIPTCKKCLADCKTCSDRTSCDTCPKNTDIWSPTTKKCVLNKARTCKDLLDWKLLPTIPKVRQTPPTLQHTHTRARARAHERPSYAANMRRTFIYARSPNTGPPST